MKKIGLISILLVFLSCEKNPYGDMTVIKDCTGSYLRHDNIDYPICNEESLEGFSNGQKVRAGLAQIEKCVYDHEHCTMVHNHETAMKFFEVKHIEKR